MGGETLAHLTRNKLRYIQIAMAVVSLVAFLLMMIATRHFYSTDVKEFQIPWWNYIAGHGWMGIITLNQHGGNYTTIWYVVIGVFDHLKLYPDFPIEYNIKAIAIFCTLASSVCMFFIAKHFRPGSLYTPIVSAIVVLFLPAFFFDAMKTNLPDSVYLMFCLYSFFCFIKKKRYAAWFLLGMGACFKLMAIYLAPVYIYFYFKNFRKSSWTQRFAPVAGLLSVVVCSLPDVILGGNFLDAIIKPLFSRGGQALGSVFSMWQFFP